MQQLPARRCDGLRGQMTHSSNAPPILQMTGIHKAFAGVQALDDVDFRLLPGEVHALLGENGAGKSTLIKVLTGALRARRGDDRAQGRAACSSRSPLEAQRGGRQRRLPGGEPLPEPLGGGEHLHRPRAAPPGAGSSGARCAAGRRRRSSASTSTSTSSALLSTYSLAVQQMVAIARAIDISADVLILDEPTSSLDQGEVEQLFDVIRQLASQGIAVVFVSHFLDQVYEIADRITVLRNGQPGRRVADGRADAASSSSRRCSAASSRRSRRSSRSRARRVDELEATTPVLEAKAVGRKRAIAPFDLALHRRGRRPRRAARLRTDRARPPALRRRPVRLRAAPRRRASRSTIRNPRVATAHGVAFCPENRRTEGLVEDLTVRENIVLALQAARGWTRPDPPQAPGRARRALDPRARHPDAERRAAGAHPQRRQPAEGAARPLAAHAAEAAHPRRADARHRRRREDRDPAARRLALRRRHVRAVHLGRDRGGAAPEPQGRGAARPRARRGARERRRRDDRLARAHDRRAERAA